MMSFRPPWEDGQAYSEAHPTEDPPRAKGKGTRIAFRGGMEIPRKDKPGFYMKWVRDHLPPPTATRHHATSSSHATSPPETGTPGKGKHGTDQPGGLTVREGVSVTGGGGSGGGLPSERVQEPHAREAAEPRQPDFRRPVSNHETRLHDAGAAVLYGLHFGILEGHSQVQPTLF